MSKEVRVLQALLDGEVMRKGSLRVLEAGCGSVSNFNFGEKVRLVGIDISSQQLQRNPMLHEKIVGDVQDYQLEPDSFDIIICWDVLEHLDRPERALHRFERAIKPGGILILKVPNVLSVKGLVTKFLPYTLHVLVYRFFYGDKNAGMNDTPPFKTHLRFSASPNAIGKLFSKCGWETRYFLTFDVSGREWLRRRRLVYQAYMAVKMVCRLLSLGYINDSEFILVLQKIEQRNSTRSRD